jgi:hypothetical protein
MFVKRGTIAMIPKNASVKGTAFAVSKSKGKLGSPLASDEICENTITLVGNGKSMTLTVDSLTQAIKNSIDRTGMPDDQARAMAQHVMNFFGYSERIIDNILEPEDRDAFYMLEDTGILTTEREETTLYDGREWRIHYWLFRKERIFELISGNGSGTNLIPSESVYDGVPEEAWQRS